MLHEYSGNIHMHTTYSDGTGDFDELIDAAVVAELDYVYVTDHNLLVRREEEGYRRGVLTMVGQEVHDIQRKPSRSHLLCFGVDQDVTGSAAQPQQLIDAVSGQNGLTFLAHPVEEWTDLAPFHYSWEDWDVESYTGVELWNYMSGFRGLLTSRPRSLMVAYFPHLFTSGPVSGMLQKWDELTQERAVVAIGGTDVHAWNIRRGLLRRRFLPYHHCTQALNTHILSAVPFRKAEKDVDMDDPAVQHDHDLTLQALRSGHCWIGYDLVGATRGFRFSAWQLPPGTEPDAQEPPHAIMGDTLAIQQDKVTWLRALAPEDAQISLLHDGKPVASCEGRQLDFSTALPGVYRVEVRKRRWGKSRGWIYSNPIYVR